jgi:hypothetical protein
MTTQLNADVTYYDLERIRMNRSMMLWRNSKRFVAVAKVSPFDPYQAGATDDTTGPAGYCEEVEFEND